MKNNPYAHIYIMDSTGKILSDCARENLGNPVGHRKHIARILSLASSGYFIDDLNDIPTLVCYTKSSYNHWIFVSEIPLTYLTDRLSHISKITFLACSILTLLGIVIAYFLSRSMYNPIQKLVDKTKSYQKEIALSVDAHRKDDFAFLTGVLDRVIVKNKNLERSFWSSLPVLKERFVISLLNNQISTLAEIKNNIAFLDLDMTSRHYTVALIEIDKYPELLAAHTTKDINLNKFAIRNMTEEIIGSYFNSLSAEVNENQIAVIINLTGVDADAVRTDLMQMTRQVKNTICNILDFTVTIGVGTIYQDITQVYLAYKEALDVIKHKLVLGENRIIFYDELTANNEINYYYPLQLEAHIVNNIKLGNYEKILLYLEEIRLDITKNHKISYENIYRLYSRLLDASINVLTEMNGSIKAVFGEDYLIYKELAKRETLEEINEWMCFVFEKITGYISCLEKGRNKNIEEVLAFINGNYALNLSVDMIAEQVRLNPTYLSRVFKQDTGKTIIEYLTLTRLAQSKKLLENTGLTINEIAKKVGYNNIHSYIRYFKKFEGITPGEYRKNSFQDTGSKNKT